MLTRRSRLSQGVVKLQHLAQRRWGLPGTVYEAVGQIYQGHGERLPWIPVRTEHPENMKNCYKCKLSLDLASFNVAKTSRDGLHWWCKVCLKSYRENNKERIKVDNKKYKETKKRCQREWKDRNRDRLNAYRSRPERLAKRRTRDLARSASDINLRLKKSLRERLRKAIKSQLLKPSMSKIEHLIGCSFECFKNHMESQFLDGMDWSNWAQKGWHVDHVKPLVCFDLSSPDEVLKAMHYTNLQPLWWRDNLSKGCLDIGRYPVQRTQ